MSTKRVLVVDDEPSICWSLQRMLETEGHEVVVASSAEEGLEKFGESDMDLVLLDVRLPRQDGISALPEFVAAKPDCPVIVMTAFGDLETAVGAVKNGATEYLTKPFDLDEVRAVCRRSLAPTPSATATETPPVTQTDDTPRLIGKSPAMQHAFRQIALVANSNLSVLITGETGTGKELVAAAIHQHSQRSDHVYLPIAPVALNPDLIESELFGHARGSFTGATEDRAGLFERAEGGTILLDEIGDLPLGMQVKLLRVLEQGEYARVGDVTPHQCNVRVIAATHCDLHALVREGKFREDLFYRLGGLHIHLPPLRERVEDIPLLCEHFQRAHGTASSIPVPVLAELSERPWHGNVRELRNAVHHACVVSQGRPLVIEDFPPPQPGRDENTPSHANNLQQAILDWLAGQDQSTNDLLSRLHAAVEPILFQRIMQQTNHNRGKTADLLGIHRGTLREKLKAYGNE